MSIDLAKELNPEQAKAAGQINGPVLIIAGAGSGKTRMITYRIAHMLEQGINEKEILALTFTNKAAQEMSERIRALTGKPLKHLTTTTFHSFGLGLLKQYIQYLGYKNNFTIYDTNDNLALLKETIINLGYNLMDYSTNAVLSLFSDMKTGRKVKPLEEKSVGLKEIYDEWRLSQKAYNVVDFDDLILLPIQLFEERPEILEKVQDRYRYIMVDEFQDTSLLQYKFVSSIALKYRNLCVVGDDDQSIYSWRGANYQNLVLFERDFPERVEIKLERNYRSTGTILDAANSVIVHNKERKAKKLWTESGKGATIRLMNSGTGDEEAESIAFEIKQRTKKEGLSYSDFGILVRTNSLIPTLENALQENGIPCQISGGQSFFDRKEIRDILCYIKFLINIDDDNSLLRIINRPRRGIGRVSIEKLRKFADQKKTTVYDAVSQFAYAGDSPVKGKSQEKLREFTELVNKWENHFKAEKASKVIWEIINDIDYKYMLFEEYPDNDKVVEFKMKSLEFLIQRIERFERNNPTSSISEYINLITLDNKDDINTEDGKVNLLTMHASKGLEYDIVYLPGLEDNIIPSSKALLENEDAIYEERRLFYVAITRARKELILSNAEKRKDYMGELKMAIPSRFIEEIPKALLEQKVENSLDMLNDFLASLKL